jgi:hypothetical protein
MAESMVREQPSTVPPTSVRRQTADGLESNTFSVEAGFIMVAVRMTTPRCAPRCMRIVHMHVGLKLKPAVGEGSYIILTCKTTAPN